MDIFRYTYYVKENQDIPELKITLIPKEVREDAVSKLALVLSNCIVVAEMYNGKEVPIDCIENWKSPVEAPISGSIIVRFPERNLINSYLLLLENLGIIF